MFIPFRECLHCSAAVRWEGVARALPLWVSDKPNLLQYSFLLYNFLPYSLLCYSLLCYSLEHVFSARWRLLSKCIHRLFMMRFYILQAPTYVD